MLEAVLEVGFFFAALALAPIGIVFLIVGASRRSRRLLLAGAVALTFALSVLGRSNYAEFWLIDACLDRGGHWEYDTEACSADGV